MAVRFDADGEDFTRLDAPNGNVYSVVGWLKLAVDRNTFTTWYCFDTGATSNYTLMQTSGDGTSMEFVEHNTSPIAGPTMTVGTWYRLGVTKAGNGLAVNLYWRAEGDPSTSTNSGTSFSNNAAVNRLRIGESIFAGEWLNGSQAALKFYSGAVLSQAEVEAEWASLAAVRTSDLWGEYRFASGALSTDASGNGRTLSGGAGATFEADPTFGGGGGGTPVPVFAQHYARQRRARWAKRRAGLYVPTRMAA